MKKNDCEQRRLRYNCTQRDFDMMMESKGEEKNSLSSFQLRSAWINDLTRLTSDNAAFTVGQSGGDQKR